MARKTKVVNDEEKNTEPSEIELDIEKTRGTIFALNDMTSTVGWGLLEKLFRDEMGEWILKLLSAESLHEQIRAQASIAILQSIIGKPAMNIKELKEYMDVLKANDRSSDDMQKEMGENITQYLQEQGIV